MSSVITEALWTADDPYRRDEFVCFKGVGPGKLTMFYWMAPHLGVHKQCNWGGGMGVNLRRVRERNED